MGADVVFVVPYLKYPSKFLKRVSVPVKESPFGGMKNSHGPLQVFGINSSSVDPFWTETDPVSCRFRKTLKQSCAFLSSPWTPWDVILLLPHIVFHEKLYGKFDDSIYFKR